MAIQNGSNRITKIYHGSNLVYDGQEGQWQTIPLLSPFTGTAQYMLIKGRIIFNRHIDNPGDIINFSGGRDMLTLPNNIKGIQLASDRYLATEHNYPIKVTLNGNSIHLTNVAGVSSGDSIELASITLTYTK